jgi:hypothetical protein
MNTLSLVGMQLPETYKENFDVSRELVTPDKAPSLETSKFSLFPGTVEPLLSGPPLSGHPLLNGHISKFRNLCNTNTINYPSIDPLHMTSQRR